VTSEIGRLFLPFCGSFSGTPAEGLKQAVLLRSSSNSDLTDRMLAQFGNAPEFNPSGKEYALAVKLTGRFKTAFPDGKPSDEPDNVSTNDVDATPKETWLKESASDNVVILVGDADMLHEQFYANIRNLFGTRVIMPFSHNLTLVQNMVEQLAGDENLMAIRSRGVLTRPFTKLRELEAEAEKRFASKIEELQKSEQEFAQKLNALLRDVEPGQRVILSEDARKERERLLQKQVEVREALRETRRNLKKEKQGLQVRIEWTNILLMPAVVTLAGVTLAVVKRKKTAAR